MKRASKNTPSAPAAAHFALDQALPLLGGLSADTFMRRHWQKKPLLIRQAMPGVTPPLDRASLFALAASDEVESRLIVQSEPGPASRGRRAAGACAPGWSLRHGPLARRSLPALSQPRWTLLVQGLDLHVPAAHDLLNQFRFIPDARLDDVMVSYATDGGGVGAHFDSYDVFLLQVHGTRRWRIGPLSDERLVPGLPLKVLSHFEAEQEWVLEPGDMLYLPPRWAHDGVAVGECMTCSIGFRVPEAQGLASEMLVRMAEHLEPGERLYRDPKQAATAEPGRIPASLQEFAAEAVLRALKDPAQWQSALGELMTEPKPKVWFRAGDPLAPGVEGVVLDARTRMLYDDQRVYANGESWRAAGADARVLRTLADRRRLTAAQWSRASDGVRELLSQWAEDGWLHPHQEV